MIFDTRKKRQTQLVEAIYKKRKKGENSKEVKREREIEALTLFLER